MLWTRSIDLIHWADAPEARHRLPLLIRRLIRRTVRGLQSLSIPAGDQTQRPGFDGVVETTEGTEFVPEGRSVWEMGADKDPKAKAEKEFRKRTETTPDVEQRRSVFVFVTPRPWIKKDEWARAKKGECSWSDVLVKDVNDLEHWLETAPDVDLWFSRFIGRLPDGVQDLESYWNSLRAIAEHPLSSQVFTASREAEATAIGKWLSGTPDSLFLQTDGLADGLDFVAALSDGQDHPLLQNGVIVYTHEAWRQLGATRSPIILIAGPTLSLRAADTTSAVEAGHYVLVSGPRGVVDRERSLMLRRQDHHSLSEALIASGYSESRALSLAKACCGSSSVLKRLITKHPETVFPAWCHEDVRAELAPFALIGGWRHVDCAPTRADAEVPHYGAPAPMDTWLVREFVGSTSKTLDDYVSRWSQGSEPLFLRFGQSVLVTSREDAWYLLRDAISEEHLKRFREVALLVLEEDDPAFQLTPDQRWLANLYGKVRHLSEELRRSIVETLAIMATYRPEQQNRALRLSETVRWVVERALPSGAGWQRWASFGFNLTFLAEADPEFFLSRVEEDLGSQAPALPDLFDTESDHFFGSSIHCHILWALEALAWSPDFLRRAAIALARLAARIPREARTGNRPDNSLREIFLLWLWHTNASIEQRIDALSAVLLVEPEVGWKLITGLLPSGTTSFSHNSHMPRWRPWADGWSREKIHPETGAYAVAIADLIIVSAGNDAARWAQIVDGMLRFSPEISQRVFLALEAIALGVDRESEAAFSLWTVLRAISNRHERYSDAQWAFDEPTRNRIANIRDSLEPANLVWRFHWLFDYHVELPDIDPADDFNAYDKALLSARQNALREIVSRSGAEGIFQLLGRVSDANTIGWLIAKDDLLTWQDIDLPAILDDEDRQLRAFTSAFIASAFSRAGWEFVSAIPVEGWSVNQIAVFAHCLPFRGDVWKWLANLGSAIDRAYWKDIRGFLRKPRIEEVYEAAARLMEARRAFAAIGIVYGAIHDKLPVPSDFIGQVLEGALAAEGGEDPRTAPNIRYELQQLIKLLQRDESFDRMRLARIEWAFLPVLDKESSEVGPETLVRMIAYDPKLFVDLLVKAYRGRNEPRRDETMSEGDQLMARQAYQFLDGLDRLPGLAAEDSGLNAELANWVARGRELADAANRMEVFDLTLGKILGRLSESMDLQNWAENNLAQLMETIGTEDLFAGFINGCINSRGVTTRDPRDGGEQERAEAEKYRTFAQSARSVSGKLADAFLMLAKHYEESATREDERAERVRLGR